MTCLRFCAIHFNLSPIFIWELMTCQLLNYNTENRTAVCHVLNKKRISVVSIYHYLTLKDSGTAINVYLILWT